MADWINNYMDMQLVYQEACESLMRTGKRSGRHEAMLVLDPYWAYIYARDVLKGRWLLAEPGILDDLELAFNYSRLVIKGRWPEYEAKVIKDKYFSMRYAIGIQCGRWPEGEAEWVTDIEWSFCYATRVLNKRWLEVEERIAKSDLKKLYLEKFPEAEDEWILKGWVEWV